MDNTHLLEASLAVDTPVAVVDLRAMEANLQAMARRAKSAGVRLRPHAKTHKSPYVAARQIAHGACGLTVATMVEAEVFADAGVSDLLIAYPPVGPLKLQRLAALAERVQRLAVAVDHVAIAASIPLGVEAYWEVDCGLHRLGTLPGKPTADHVARLLCVIGPDRFRGLLTHGGHSYRADNDDELKAASATEAQSLLDTAAVLDAMGIACHELSVGSTPTSKFAGEWPGITEMRPGTYVYGDANQVALERFRLEDCALGVVATVVSCPERTRAVIDAGSKSLSTDVRVHRLESLGIVLDHPHLRLDRVSEEHAVLVADGPAALRVGQRVVVVPAHVCTTVNLHPAILMVDEHNAWWDPVSARGWRSIQHNREGSN